MKKIIIAALILLGLHYESTAQAAKPTNKQAIANTKNSTVDTKKVTKNASVTPVKKEAADTKKATGNVKQAIKADDAKMILPLKNDITSLKRHNNAKGYKKDGTPDMRYKQHK